LTLGGGAVDERRIVMQKMKNHLIGVDQGTAMLFSDFENGGEMWIGKGARSRRVPIKFSDDFRKQPIVQIQMDMWDMDIESNERADIKAENVTPKGFEIVFNTWGDTKIARARASWTAIGEVSGDDEWDMD
jgi:hypothetical protein